MGDHHQPYVTIRSRRPADGTGSRSADGTQSAELHARSATHDTSRTSFHLKHLGQFAQRLEDSAARAFPNRGRHNQRYKKVQALLLHWNSDDLFVIPELEDLERCLREDYSFDTGIFAIPSENPHLELMMRVGQLIKEHESEDTLFLIYYGGHARIDESRQSTWTRDAGSPWLQWSAIQTLLERSRSDVLILLDCCAGAASATFPNGTSITETISASSWDAIAPDPGRYSFTNILIEVLQEWRVRTFSAAMLHAEVLARLKHPRPVTINGKHFEARSTPVHFMMTSNHKAPSIELSRTLGEDELPMSPPEMPHAPAETGRAAEAAAPTRQGPILTDPNEDTPHVMISLALEDDQSLDIATWEQWLNAFPAMAKYVKVQGVFKSHSTLLLVSMPVTVWDLLPEDHATSFVAFIRSNNLAVQGSRSSTVTFAVPAPAKQSETTVFDSASMVSGTTFTPTENFEHVVQDGGFTGYEGRTSGSASLSRIPRSVGPAQMPNPPPLHLASTLPQLRPIRSDQSLYGPQRQQTSPFSNPAGPVTRRMILNQQQSSRRTTFGGDVPEPRKFSAHVEKRLEEYYQFEPLPNDGQKAFFASNLGVEPWHIEIWFHHRREKDAFAQGFASLKIEDARRHPGVGISMMLPANLNEVLNISFPGQVLVVDLRSQVDYHRSHVAGALHLRLPQSFLASVPLEMVERAFTDASSRTAFSMWRRARCIVFYSRQIELPSDCPLAETMLDRLWSNGWVGRGFALKGHYREFSESYSGHIVRNVSSPEAIGTLEHVQVRAEDQPQSSSSSNEEELTKLLSQIEQEHRPPAGTSSAPREEQLQALADHEKQLESEFKSRFPDFYSKARDTNDPTGDADSFVTKAQMVEYLDRGLSKMRTQAATLSAITYDPGHSKLAAESPFDRPPSIGPPQPPPHEAEPADEYVEISREEEQFAGDPGHLTRPADGAASNSKMMTTDEVPRRGRGGGGGGGGGILGKVFRRG